MVKRNAEEGIENIAKRYAELLKSEFKKNSLYIFGSYVKGNYNEDSDIDIAVVADEFTGDIVDDTMKLLRIRRRVDTRIEPHPFTSSEFNMENPFAREILLKGLRIL